LRSTRTCSSDVDKDHGLERALGKFNLHKKVYNDSLLAAHRRARDYRSQVTRCLSAPGCFFGVARRESRMTRTDKIPLVETDWLSTRLEDASIRVLECTSYNFPADPYGYRAESGRAKWREGHIPCSAFADLAEELCDSNSEFRFMLPSAIQFSETMSRLGVGEGVHVVLYDRGMNMWASRVWWMLRAFGFDDASVLNGGWRKWRHEGRPVSSEKSTFERRQFVARPRPDLFTDKSGVLAALNDPSICVLNALTEEQYLGTGGVHYGRPGRITGSVNVPAQSLVDPETHAYLDAESLKAKFDGVDALDADKVVTYCGGGIAASSAAFVLTLLGHECVTVYDASMSEWAADPRLPMETG
jgi:thiosulfate/3-mercaptopyruvate sulfurtransferase